MKRILLFGLGLCVTATFAQNVDLETKKINYQPKVTQGDNLSNQPIKRN